MAGWEIDPIIVPGARDAAAPTQLVFWVCKGGGIHQGWATSLPRNSEGSVRTTIRPVRVVAGDTPESHCGCPGRPAEGWGGLILSQVLGEGCIKPV